MGFFKKVGAAVKRCAKSLAAVAVAAVGIFSSATVHAEEVSGNTIVMPSGVDIPGLITSGVAVLGGVVAVAIAAWGGWVLVKKCLAWVRKSF